MCRSEEKSNYQIIRKKKPNLPSVTSRIEATRYEESINAL